MLTLFVVIADALVILAIAAAVNRRQESLPYGARTSGTDDGASSWMPVMSGDGGDSACTGSDAGSGCDGGGASGGDGGGGGGE